MIGLMRWFGVLAARCLGLLADLFAHRPADASLREELLFHVELQTAENVRRGMPPNEARRAALVAAGGLTAAAEAVHERRTISWAENLLVDARYALRSLRQNPGFTWAVVLTLALGIGANATMFTIVNAVVLRPLPYPQADRIMSLSIHDQDGSDMQELDDKSYDAWRAGSRSFEEIGAYGGGSVVMRGVGGPQSIRAVYGTKEYFDALAVAPERGRLFTAEETKPGGAPMAVISDQLWRSAFGADARIIGRSVKLDDSTRTIIGIMPASFTTTRGPRIWLPYHPRNGGDKSTFFYQAIGRLRPGVTLASARVELATIAARIRQPAYGPQVSKTPIVMTLHDRRFGEVRRPLYLLLAAVGTLLLIACLNLANLAIARSVRRQREFSLRRALGARGARLVSYVMLESCFLSLGGAVLGLSLALISIKTVVRLSPTTISHADAVGVDGRVLLFTFAIALATALGFGLVPALASSRGDLNQVLSAGSTRNVGSARQRKVRGLVVVGELATALVLLSGAGLVAKSFWRVTSIDPGFTPNNLVAANVELPWDRYKDSATATAFFDEFMRRVHAIPATDSAVIADVQPLGGSRFSFGTNVPGHPEETHRFDVLGVGQGYFGLLGIRLVQGRVFDSRDAGGPPVMVVTEAMARTVFPDGDAVGKPFAFNGGSATIIGVVANVHQRGGLEGTQESVGFVPISQVGAGPYQTVLFRTRGSPDGAEDAITSVFRSLQPSEPPPTFTTMDQVLADEVAPRKFLFALLGTFAAVAGVLAVIGLYGVLSYLVAEQTREIGIRAALGADQRRLVSLFLRQGGAMVVTGTGTGVIVALLTVKALSGLLYQMSPRDPQTLLAAVVLLVVVSMLACYIPAWRASRLDPLVALRVD